MQASERKLIHSSVCCLMRELHYFVLQFHKCSSATSLRQMLFCCCPRFTTSQIPFTSHALVAFITETAYTMLSIQWRSFSIQDCIWMILLWMQLIAPAKRLSFQSPVTFFNRFSMARFLHTTASRSSFRHRLSRWTRSSAKIRTVSFLVAFRSCKLYLSTAPRYNISFKFFTDYSSSSSLRFLSSVTKIIQWNVVSWWYTLHN